MMGALSSLDVSMVTGYVVADRFFAVESQQGGRVVHAVHLPLSEVPRVLPVPDPQRPTPGNRRVNLTHAAGFGKYVREQPQWVAPPLLVRDVGECTFEAQATLPDGTKAGILSVPRTSRSAIKIIDGQHRILGIDIAVRTLDQEIATADENLGRKQASGDSEGSAAAKEQLDELLKLRQRYQREHFTVCIYNENVPQAYEQMFFDVADNALGINQAVKIRFDSRKVLNRTLYETSKHALLKNRVDMEQDRITGPNPNWIGAKHVIDLVRSCNVGVAGRIGARREAELDEGALVGQTNAFLDCLLDGFAGPLEAMASGSITPAQLRTSSLLGSVTMLRVLAGVFFNLSESDWNTDEITDFFAWLAPHMSAPIREDSIWEATKDFNPGSHGPLARTQNLKHLTEAITSWALSGRSSEAA